MSNMVIQTNILALNAHRNLSTVGNVQSKSSSRLSSGYRVNSAADDAAGLAISEKMRSQVRGLDMAAKNAQDGISLIQTAEGSMNEIGNMTQRVRELVIQSANSTLEESDRNKIADEVQQLLDEITNMAGRTEFNKKILATGSYSEGPKTNMASGMGNSKIYVFKNGVYVSIGTMGANQTSASLIKAQMLKYSAAVTRGETKFSSMKDLSNNAITSRYANVNGATRAGVLVTSIIVGGTTKMATGAKLYLQVGANAGQKIEFNIGSLTASSLGISNVADAIRTLASKAASGAGSLGISMLLNFVDLALEKVSEERAKLGAVQNRLEYTINNLKASSENLSASESRIRDADMAKEMMNMTKANVLQQAATSMLAQANQAPQAVLKLLG